jgi:hypothetical protein
MVMDFVPYDQDTSRDTTVYWTREDKRSDLPAAFASGIVS